jgi:hypothetical protein
VSEAYGDDRPGMMRVHIARERANAACRLYTRAGLNAHARSHGISTSHRLKYDLAWYMAQHGLIDRDGSLRDGFPSEAS